MADMLEAINNTPVPNLLIVFGGVLLFLAFVGKFGTYIELPAQRQRLAGIVGVILLLIGTTITIVAELPSNTGISPLKADRKNSNTSLNDANKIETDGSSPAQKDSSQEQGDDEANIFTGPLGTLLPDLSLLPEGLSLTHSGEIQDEEILKWSVDKEEARRLYMDNNDYLNLIHVYSHIFCEPIYSIIFIVEKLANAEQSSELFDFIAEQKKKRSETIGFEQISNNSHGSDESTVCSYGGNHASISSGRSTRRENVILHVWVMYLVDSVEQYKVDQLLSDLMNSMLDRIDRG